MSSDFARRLRKNMTDAERHVWEQVRRGALGGHRFRRQHPLGPYVVDFVCLERRLVIELDGGQHAERAEHDAKRTAWLKERGYRVVRFWNHDVLADWETVVQEIWRWLQREEVAHPPP